MEKTITRRWSDFLANTTFDALPPEVVHQTKMLILDSLGCALGAYSLKLGKMVVARVQAVEGITRTLTCPVVHL
jgi:2-methylcitrate dehydratase PrpD